MPNRIKISVLNKSTCVSDDEIADCVVNALQPQVSNEFFSAWSIDAELTFVKQPPPGTWWLVILDETDQDGWFGYHITAEKLPLAKVFAKTIAKEDGKWTVSASHEVLEMLADPTVNRMISDRKFDPANLPRKGEKRAAFYALEVCDPVAPDDIGYKVGIYTVSDFVFPAWYERKGVAPFDQTQRLTGPFMRVPGGYNGIYTCKDGWQLVADGPLSPYRTLLEVGGRTWLRTQQHSVWKPVPSELV
jgi:hypothetical protein